ncbi:MAG TPA: hypothetical protein VK746_09760, partial [Candidatus Eisenbacteria bacterium]|nr:hypothetical protein [Candidatus Eisenbacteria bacterium]
MRCCARSRRAAGSGSRPLELMRTRKPARAGLHVGVIGEGVCSRRVAALAERVGRAIAEAGAVLLCGG